MKHIDNHEYDKAITCFSQVIKTAIWYENIRNAYFERGNAYNHKGNYDEAIKDYTKCIQMRSNDGMAYIKCAQVLRKKGNDAEALHYLNAALKKDIATYYLIAQIFTDIAEIYTQQKKSIEAEKYFAFAFDYFTKSIQLESNQAKGYEGLGNHYFRNKKFAESFDYFKQAAELDSKLKMENFAITCSRRGYEYYKVGDFTTAIKYFKTAIHHNPNIQNIADIYKHLGNGYYCLQLNNKEALKNYIQYLSHGPHVAQDEDFTVIISNLKNILAEVTYKDIREIKQKVIFNLILLLPKKEQIPLLKQCLHSHTSLGQRMWDTAQYTGLNIWLNYEREGILQNICDHLKKIDPLFKIPTVVASKNLFYEAKTVSANFDLHAVDREMRDRDNPKALRYFHNKL